MNLEVERAAESPAVISFEVRNRPADVCILYEDSVGRLVPITAAGESENPSLGVMTAGETPFRVQWNFTKDFGPDVPFRSGFSVVVAELDGTELDRVDDVAMGNTTPVVADVRPLSRESEQSGSTTLRFKFADEDGDVLQSAGIEYNAVEGFPDSGWKLARPAGIASDRGTPERAFNLVPVSGGEAFDFEWDSSYEGFEGFVEDKSVVIEPQLPGMEASVIVRVVARDEFAEGNEAVSEPFRLDNNRVPEVELDDLFFLANDDTRRGVAIPFRYRDAESDLLRVAVQWTRVEEGLEGFPDLPPDPQELQALLLNPERAEERIEKRIAGAYPVPFGGRIEVPLVGGRVRLPELAGSEAGLLALGLPGQVLEVLDPSNVPTLRPWNFNHPVAIEVLGDGSKILVLEEAADGWRAVRADARTGEIERGPGGELKLFASGPGAPRALGLDLAREHVFVGSSSAVFRFELATGEPMGRLPHEFIDGPRDLVGLGSEVVLATGDDSLVRFDWNGARAVLFDELSDPWGLALDPHLLQRVYLAERGADRVLLADVARGVLAPLVAEVAAEDRSELGSVAFPSPRSLAIERSGDRLLVLSETSQSPSLRVLDLGRADDLELMDGRAEAFVTEVTRELTEAHGDLAVGPLGSRFLTLPSSGAIARGGAVAQVRTIRSYRPESRIVVVEPPFDPPLTTGDTWRIQPRPAYASGPEDRRGVFIWDSAEVPGGGLVSVRVVALDNDAGTPNTGLSSTKRLRSGLDVVPVRLDLSERPSCSVAGDLDGDGDLDLATGTSNGVRVHVQRSPGQFVLDPQVLGSGRCQAIVAGDVDGDFDLDILSLSATVAVIQVFKQVGAGEFLEGEPIALAGLSDSLVASDINGDRDLDLVVVSADADTVTILLGRQGEFSLEEAVVVPLPRPRAVAVADLDGDARRDLVVATASDLRVLYQERNGEFVDSGATLSFPGVEVYQSVAIADLDRDGDADIVAANRSGSRRGSVNVFLQERPREFGGFQEIEVLGFNPSAVDVADLDGDGDQDLVVIDVPPFPDGSSGSVLVFSQGPLGKFHPPQGEPTEVGSPRSVALADLEGDGDVDIVCACAFPDSVAVFLQDDPGTFFAAGTPLNFLGASVSAADVADFDADGDLDLALGIRSADDMHQVVLLLQASPGNFVRDLLSPLMSSEDPDDRVLAVAAGDINNDRQVDVVASTPTGIQFLTRGEAVFEPTIDGVALADFEIAGVNNIQFANFDRDALLDLALTNGSKPILLMQVAAGRFRRFEFGGPEFPGASFILPVDLNGDGNLDFVTANHPSGVDENGSLSFFYQSDAGDFRSTGPVAGPDLPEHLVAGDFDGDGDVDIAAAGARGLTLVFQEAGGEFVIDGNSPLATTTTKALAVATADVDEDGDPDLVNESLEVFLQVAPGRFLLDPRSPRAEGIGVIVDDMDGDGELDALSFGDGLTIHFGGR